MKTIAWMSLAAALTAGQPAMAASGPPIVADVFAVRPALDKGTARCPAAQRFASYIAAGEFSKLPELFAPDAVWLTPMGAVLHGPREVAEFMPKVQAALAPMAPVEEIPISSFADGRDCFFELAVKTKNEDKFSLTAIHHITVGGSGKIVQMISYGRPRPDPAQ